MDELKSIVDSIYAPPGVTSAYGNGTVMVAVLREKETGTQVGGKWHELKAPSILKRLSNLLQRNAESNGTLLDKSDFNTATNLAEQLTNTLNAPDVAGKATEALSAPGQQSIRGVPQKLYEYTKNLTDSYAALRSAESAMPNSAAAAAPDPATEDMAGSGGVADALGAASDILGTLSMVIFLGSALYGSTQPGASMAGQSGQIAVLIPLSPCASRCLRLSLAPWAVQAHGIMGSECGTERKRDHVERASRSAVRAGAAKSSDSGARGCKCIP